MKTPQYDITVHGVDHSQSFQGVSLVFTSYAVAVIGIGHNAKEAYLDAVEQVYACADKAELLHLPKHPRGIRVTDCVVPDDVEECYCYVSIRYNLPA